MKLWQLGVGAVLIGGIAGLSYYQRDQIGREWKKITDEGGKMFSAPKYRVGPDLDRKEARRSDTYKTVSEEDLQQPKKQLGDDLVDPEQKRLDAILAKAVEGARKPSVGKKGIIETETSHGKELHPLYPISLSYDDKDKFRTRFQLFSGALEDMAKVVRELDESPSDVPSLIYRFKILHRGSVVMSGTMSPVQIRAWRQGGCGEKYLFERQRDGSTLFERDAAYFRKMGETID